MESLTVFDSTNIKQSNLSDNFEQPIDYLTISNVNNKSTNVGWTLSAFTALELSQLYSILALRESIFIVEQNVPYLDIDGKDPHCMHLMGTLDNEVVCYMRIVPLDLFEPGFYSLGRVIVKSSFRSSGFGRKLVQLGINHLDGIRNNKPIKISSQLYLRDFYASFGFVVQGEPYIEDQIPHVAMIRS